MTGRPVIVRQNDALRVELAELKTRLAEAENVLCAIRSGEVDAIVVDTSGGEQLFVLRGAEQPYREMVETMSEGAVTVTSDGVILYSNQRFAEMARANLQSIIGSNLLAYCTADDAAKVLAALGESQAGVPRFRATLLAADATRVPVNMAMRGRTLSDSPNIVIVVTDLTQLQATEQARERAIRALRILNVCADVIIHSEDEVTMLGNICQAMVDVGSYEFAWIGYAGDNPSDAPRAGARAVGTGEHGEHGEVATAADTAHDAGSIDLAIRSRRIVMAHDVCIEDDSQASLCLTPDAGYRASVTVPLRNGDDVFGAWAICSDDPNAFVAEELELLTTLANDLAFGIIAQRNKNARSQLASIVESSGDAILTRDLQGSVTTWNNAAERLFGYRADEIIGNPMAMLCPRELVGESTWLFEKIRRGDAVEQFETIRLTKDGRRLYVSLTFSPIRDATGDIVAASVFMRDATARRNSEDALRFRESALRVEADKLQSILDSMAEAIIVADKDGHIIQSNPAACDLYGATALTGTVQDWAIHCGLCLPDRSTPLTFDENPLLRALHGQDTNDLELYIKRSDSAGVHIDLTGRSVRAADGSVSGGLIVFADITQRKQSEVELLRYRRHLEELVAARTDDLEQAKASNAELERVGRQLEQARGAADQANQAKSRFLTSITHELRTPLHGMLGYAELLGLEGGLNDRQAERVAAMIAAGEHLLRLINAVLDVGQIEADRLELRPMAIELSGFAKSCLDLVRLAAETKGLTLLLTATGPLRISADVTRLRQVLLNLLGNAIKFTPSGTVELRLARTQTDEFVRLEVADTGPGIWARHRDKLFQSFERLNADAVAGIEGAGLGLALSERLVRAMGGRIGYEDNPCGGSVFWLELPINNADAGCSVAAAMPARPARSGLRVLVADDDALNRDIASKFLALGGHVAVCVNDGAAAVDAATAENFDVILMDVRMPGMNGLEATRRIRALPAPRGKVPVIALTAQAFAEQIEICRKAGMDTHVSKPFKQAVLLAAVEEIVATPVGGAPKAMPPAIAPATSDPELPVFDRAAFEDTIDCLAPGEAAEHLRTLLARGEALQCNLRAPDIQARAGELSAAGHKLAGGAAMLGFLSLADCGRRFEVAADSGMPDTAALADQLATAIDGAMAIIRQELAAMAATAT